MTIACRRSSLRRQATTRATATMARFAQIVTNRRVLYCGPKASGHAPTPIIQSQLPAAKARSRRPEPVACGVRNSARHLAMSRTPGRARPIKIRSETKGIDTDYGGSGNRRSTARPLALYSAAFAAPCKMTKDICHPASVSIPLSVRWIRPPCPARPTPNVAKPAACSPSSRLFGFSNRMDLQRRARHGTRLV